MTTSFTTYFGDYLHGLFITWSSTASQNTGTSELTLRMQMNLRSKLHVYGYTGTAAPSDGSYTADAEATWLNEDTELFDVFNTYGTQDPIVVATINTFGDTPVADQYHMYVAWQNPDGEANVTYDGIEVLMYAEIDLL